MSKGYYKLVIIIFLIMELTATVADNASDTNTKDINIIDFLCCYFMSVVGVFLGIGANFYFFIKTNNNSYCFYQMIICSVLLVYLHKSLSFHNNRKNDKQIMFIDYEIVRLLIPSMLIGLKIGIFMSYLIKDIENINGIITSFFLIYLIYLR